MEKVRKFLLSDIYTLLLFAGACVVIFVGKEVLGTWIFALIISLTLALTDDLIPALQGIMFTVCFAIRCKHSYEEFIKYKILIVPVVVFTALHFILYRFKPSKGKCFWGIAASSAATTLGGVGIITAKEYFSATSAGYIIALGFGMLLVYSYMCSAVRLKPDYDFSEKFSKLMASVIPMLCVCLFQEYMSRFDEFMKIKSVIPFQWRNNASTLLMLAMPFAFYLSAKHYAWFGVGMLSYIAILFAGSRGGMIFGLAELIICMFIMINIDKRHRVPSLIIVGVCVIGVFAARKYLIEITRYTIERMLDPNENSIRLGLLPRGIEDFKSNPLFGRGLGYMGNRDIHKSAEFTLCWYHCSPVQIIGSFGIAGVAGYAYLLYCRIRLFLKNITFFNITVFASYFALEMMSFVNPGIFVPFPYLFLATMYFVIIEKCNDDEDKKALSLIKEGQYK